MRPTYQTVTGIAAGNPVPLDVYLNPFNVSVSVIISASATYTVQYTLDDVFATTFNAGTANWINHSALTNQAVTNNGTLISPVRAVRLNVSASTGSCAFQVVQAGAVG